MKRSGGVNSPLGIATRPVSAVKKLGQRLWVKKLQKSWGFAARGRKKN